MANSFKLFTKCTSTRHSKYTIVTKCCVISAKEFLILFAIIAEPNTRQYKNKFLPCMQDTFARATHSAGRPSVVRDDWVSCIQISTKTE